jgi:hypothetical protein
MSSRPFTANWDGDCAECGASFDAGDEIRYNDDGDLIGEECCGLYENDAP